MYYVHLIKSKKNNAHTESNNAANKSGAGFTLIEMVVGLAVMALLSSILILYSRTGEKQIILFKEQAKVVSTIWRAKSLTLQTYAKEPNVCGYGVHFDYAPDNQFIIFKDRPATGFENCLDENGVYTGDGRYTPYSDEEFEINKLADGLELFSETFTNSLSDVLFIPPDPKIEFTPTSGSLNREIAVRIIDSSTSKVVIKITNAGQVTTQ